MHVHVPIEDAFTRFVPRIGGQRVSELLGPSPRRENADFFFPAEKVIAELKCLEEDKREDADLQAKVQALFDRWMDDGTIPLHFGAKIRVESKTLPADCQHALMEIYKKPIQRRILKANKQIKATAASLRLDDYRGLLLLANDGNYALEANAMLYLIWRVLGANFRHISNVIYFTVNMPAASPFTAKPTLVWAQVGRKHLPSIPMDFIHRLREGWMHYLQEAAGTPIEQVQVAGLEDLDLVKYATRI